MVKKENMTEDNLMKVGFEKAVELLYQCGSKAGFMASPTPKDNYRRIWSRDGVIIGMAALLTGKQDLADTFKETLRTLAQFQGPHGEIPSNVDTGSGRISYGGMTGRVDADLWFIIGCGEYWKATNDQFFLDEMIPAMEKALFLLGAWEFNNRGLLYVPETGDWADEYIHNGFVLYDQVLYLQALRTMASVREDRCSSKDHTLHEKISRLRHMIRDNYWFSGKGDVPDDVYHHILYEKGQKAADQCKGCYWVPFFSPHGYGYRFDSLANILASLLGVSDTARRKKVDSYIRSEIIKENETLIPAFYPVIKPMDHDWEELKMTFSYTFKNEPYQYHNGGLWPMISGFYAADLAARGKLEAARRQVIEIHKANQLKMDGSSWSFPEYVHGTLHTAQGTFRQGWSAAGAVIGHFALENKQFFRIK
jgi:hypothetical protein